MARDENNTPVDVAALGAQGQTDEPLYADSKGVPPPVGIAPPMPAAAPPMSAPGAERLTSPGAAVPPAEPEPVKEGTSDRAVERAFREMTRRSFVWAGVALAGTLGGLWAFNKQAPLDESESAKQAFRHVHDFNERVAQRVFFSETHRSQEFPVAVAARHAANEEKAAAGVPDKQIGPYMRVNPGSWADVPEPDLESYRLTVTDGSGKVHALTLDDVKKMPAATMTVETKCVEGWSAVATWRGVRMADFMKLYPPKAETPYVSATSVVEENEDFNYYVGLDRQSCEHPQTLIAYEMNGKPLTAGHGAPLRLVIPHKYGTKSIKRLTGITYEDERPADYWAERGYDWYAGL